jgi:diguanylate cyclase (GGDEF)-like protein
VAAKVVVTQLEVRSREAREMESQDGSARMKLNVGVRMGLSKPRLGQQLACARIEEVSTGTLKEEYYDHELAMATETAAENQRELSLVHLKLDGYDRLLERRGREVTDLVLGHVAGTIRQRLGTEPVLARVGQAEFAVLLPGATIAEASRTAERLRIAVATARPLIQAMLIPLAISVGVGSLKCAQTPTGADLTEAARRRLERASLAGGNRTVSEG